MSVITINYNPAKMVIYYIAGWFSASTAYLLWTWFHRAQEHSLLDYVGLIFASALQALVLGGIFGALIMWLVGKFKPSHFSGAFIWCNCLSMILCSPILYINLAKMDYIDGNPSEDLIPSLIVAIVSGSSMALGLVKKKPIG